MSNFLVVLVSFQAFYGVYAQEEENVDCVTDSATQNYRGFKAVTEHGFNCWNWEKSELRYANMFYHFGLTIESELLPEKNDRDHNYCRNPNGDEKNWCITGIALNGRLWIDYCDLPICPIPIKQKVNKCGQPEHQTIPTTLFSENYPKTFSKEDFTCTWNLKSPPGTRIVLNFDENFELGDGSNCLSLGLI